MPGQPTKKPKKRRDFEADVNALRAAREGADTPRRLAVGVRLRLESRRRSARGAPADAPLWEIGPIPDSGTLRWLTATLLLLGGACASPEPERGAVYMWVDEDGVEHYTFERDRIPRRLRGQLGEPARDEERGEDDLDALPGPAAEPPVPTAARPAPAPAPPAVAPPTPASRPEAPAAQPEPPAAQPEPPAAQSEVPAPTQPAPAEPVAPPEAPAVQPDAPPVSAPAPPDAGPRDSPAPATPREPAAARSAEPPPTEPEPDPYAAPYDLEFEPPEPAVESAEVRELMARIEEDRREIKRLISRTAEGREILPDPHLREVAERLARREAQLEALRAEQSP